MTDIDARCPVEADPVQLDRVLFNLLSNAVKFSPIGGRVTITAGQKDGAVVIAVADTGIGVPPEEQPQAVHPVLPLRDREARSDPGHRARAGLVREIIDHHGGEVTMESCRAWAAP